MNFGEIRGKATLRFNDCLLSESSFAKSLQILFRGAGGGEGFQPCYKSCVPQVKTKELIICFESRDSYF